MKNIHIKIDNKIPYIKDLLENFAEVEYLPYEEITNEKIKDADALIIRTRTKCAKELLEETKVSLIVTATIGTDHIDIEYCKAHGIEVRNAAGCNSGSVAQWVKEAVKSMNNRTTDSDCFGIVGLGNVGTKVKIIAESLGYKTMASDPPKGLMTNLDDIARHCRIVTFHTPLTDEGAWRTRGMASERFFSLLRPDAIVINAARGGIVDEGALIDWLKNHPEGQCAIDCWEGEPVINRELLSLSTIATPHIAGYSADGKWNGTYASVKAINEYFGINAPTPTPLPVATSHDYDIKRDSDALKRDPERFEWFRGNYPERRE